MPARSQKGNKAAGKNMRPPRKSTGKRGSSKISKGFGKRPAPSGGY